MSDYIYGSSLKAAKSKANYLFEGDFRRRPSQNLSGASRSMTGMELLQQAAEQRQNREDNRRKEIAGLKIQSVWRGYCVRKISAHLMRQNFDSEIANLGCNSSQRITRRLSARGASSFTAELFVKLSREFIIHYNSNEDKQRFDTLIDLMMRYPEPVFTAKRDDQYLWLYRLSKLHNINLRTIERQLNSNNFDNIDIYLNFLENYTRNKLGSNNPHRLTDEESANIWQSLINCKLYKIMRIIADNDLTSGAPSTVKCDSKRKAILEIVRRSLDTEPVSSSEKCKSNAACELFDQFFSGPISSGFESVYLEELMKSEPRQIKPKRLLEAFTNSHKLTKKSMRPSTLTLQINNIRHTSTSTLHTNLTDHIEQSKTTVWLCYAFLRALYTRVDEFSESEKIEYINIISSLIAPAEYITNMSLIQAVNNINDEQADDELPGDGLRPADYNLLHHQLTQYHGETHLVIKKIIDLINKLHHINNLKSIIFNSCDQTQALVQGAIVQICNLMLAHEYLAIFNCRLLYTIAFSKEFSRSLWRGIVTASIPSIYGTSSLIHKQISRGGNVSHDAWRLILPKLKLFCCLCSYLLPTLGDEEFYTTNPDNHSVHLDDGAPTERNIDYDSDIQMYDVSDAGGSIKESTDTVRSKNQRPKSSSNSTTNSGISGFYVDKELVGISAILRDICIGMIEIIYNQCSRHHHAAVQAAQTASLINQQSIMQLATQNQDENQRLRSFEIKSCFQALVRLVRQLHARDSRKQFCPDGHWICPSVVIPANKAIDFELVTSQQGRLLKQITRDEQSQDRLASISSECKTVLILQEVPFVISFHDRVQIFHQLLKKERSIHQSEGYHFGMPGSAISVQIRRNYIYEDAFEELSFDNEPNMKLPLKVSLINAVGAEEAGVDGGGLTKEFLSELLKTGFDPMRGFFKYTKDHFLYPNPSANVLFASLPGGYEVHYEFLGRVLGKAIFEKIMVELPLAGFFMAKLLAIKHSSDVDLHNLESLDPILYKNLVYLKNYKGDVADLDLDFTISNNDLGEHEMIELKPGGSKIPVSRENKIEYVHLVADYRLNKQIRIQCAAFKRGLSQLIDLDWLRMFDPRELQILISGAPTVIDVSDWRRHTVYANGYSDSNEVINTFWSVVRQLDEPQKRKLLKFATSCSLPPLLGFKDLVPQFAIAPSEEERLPTASTCMNLLKLPACENEEAMRSKLLYAIESNSGFELS